MDLWLELPVLYSDPSPSLFNPQRGKGVRGAWFETTSDLTTLQRGLSLKEVRGAWVRDYQ